MRARPHHRAVSALLQVNERDEHVVQPVAWREARELKEAISGIGMEFLRTGSRSTDDSSDVAKLGLCWKQMPRPAGDASIVVWVGR